jgi:hypothetical protein
LVAVIGSAALVATDPEAGVGRRAARQGATPRPSRPGAVLVERTDGHSHPVGQNEPVAGVAAGELRQIVVGGGGLEGVDGTEAGADGGELVPVVGVVGAGDVDAAAHASVSSKMTASAW